VAEENAVLVE